MAEVLLICLVVGQHSAEPYVTTGGDWMVNDPASSDILLSFFVLNGTYFMGFFFLISGYFLDSSISRHGAPAVAKARLVRLGIPLIVFVIFVNGAVGYAFEGVQTGTFDYIFRLYLGSGHVEFGPLWFTAQLLIYALVYIALRRLIAPALSRPKPPGHRAVLAYAMALGSVTALVRYFYPIDDWVRLFWLFPVEPARLPQYISLFVIGIVAGRGDWFIRIDSRVAGIWFAIGVAVFAIMSVFAAPRLALPGYVGLRVAWGFLEAFVCVGMILGLSVFFRQFLSEPDPWLSCLDGDVYGVYLVHVYFVIALQIAMLGFAWPGIAKFSAVAATSIVLSFILIGLLRRIPAVRRVV